MNKKMHGQVLRLAIPNILSNLTVPLVGLVDTGLMGRESGSAHLAAIALAGIIFDFIYFSLGFLRMGTTGITAQAYGADHKSVMILTLLRSLGLALGFGLLFIIFRTPIAQLGFGFANEAPEVLQLAITYFMVRILAAPITLGLRTINGWFLGMQNGVFTLFTAIFANVGNVILSIYFVKTRQLGVEGAALGTIMGQTLGFVVAILLFFIRYRQLFQHIIWKEVFEKKALGAFFKVNMFIFLRTILLCSVFYFFTVVSTLEGELTLAVNGMLLLWITTISYGIDGFAFAAESLVGKYIGQRNEKELKESIKYVFIWGGGVATLLAIVFLLFPKVVLGLLTNQPSIIQAAMPFMFWLAIAPLSNAFAYIWDGIYIGATAIKPMLIGMLIACFIVFLPSYYILDWYFPKHGLWMAFTLFMLARGGWLTFKHKNIIQIPTP